jgi:hypothetical protein
LGAARLLLCVPGVSKLQFRILAIACWLLVIVLVIPPLALHSAWTPYRDGTHITGKVEHVERGRNAKWYRADVTYGDGKRMNFYPREAPGETLELIAPTNHHFPILATELDSKRPSPWLWMMFLGIPVLGALGLSLWRAPDRAARRRAARTAPLDALVDAIHFTRKVSIGLALFFGASAPFLGIVPLFDKSAKAGVIVMIEVLAAICLGLAVWCAWRAVKMREPKQSAVFQLIEQHPNELAWFYVQEVKAELDQRGYSLHLWKTNGKQLSLNLIAEDIDAVLAAIAKQAPHARQGWTAEHERAYRQQVRSQTK